MKYKTSATKMKVAAGHFWLHGCSYVLHGWGPFDRFIPNTVARYSILFYLLHGWGPFADSLVILNTFARHSNLLHGCRPFADSLVICHMVCELRRFIGDLLHGLRRALNRATGHYILQQCFEWIYRVCNTTVINPRIESSLNHSFKPTRTRVFHLKTLLLTT